MFIFLTSNIKHFIFSFTVPKSKTCPFVLLISFLPTSKIYLFGHSIILFGLWCTNSKSLINIKDSPPLTPKVLATTENIDVLFFVLCRYFVHSFLVSGCSSLLENVALCWLGYVDLPIVNQTKSMVLQLQLAFVTVEPEMSKIWSLAKQDLWLLMYVIFCWPFSS